eukprot:TRINITY_DN1393_c0_g1_i1.p1 TRINITY_DN1393_c0_g1~~TRINITY_DN1393_c0_g1_i1.p1  ORF type:complete len:469 (+),score=87.59 TRINITY_DN1393_c0_g1_i1:195-1601(+)
MESTCEVCDSTKAKLICLNCTKLRVYCQSCFNASHKCDIKKFHEIELLITPSDEKSQAETLACSVHAQRVKEYACLDCNAPVCSECLLLGDHKGHKASNIERGFEKLVEEFKLLLPECKTPLEVKQELVLRYLDKERKDTEQLKEETKESFQGLIKGIERKEIKLIETINEGASKLREDEKLVKKLFDDLKTEIEKCNDITTLSAPNCENYNRLAASSGEAKRLKTSVDMWVALASSGKERIMDSLSHVKRELIQSKKLRLLSRNNWEEIFPSSSIIASFWDKVTLLSWISETCKNYKIDLKLLWKGSRDGFIAETFHSKCDNKGPTVTIVKSNNFIFGGYTEKSWTSEKTYVDDPRAFLFSLTHGTKLDRQKHAGKSIYCSDDIGPTFGGGHDFYVCYNVAPYNANSSKGNQTYELPEGVDADTYLAGSKPFSVAEIEVYSVITLSLIHICRCRRIERCRSRWSPYH